MITVTIKVFLFGLLTTFFNFCTQYVLLPAQVEVSLTLNDPPTRLIFRIDVDMAGVGGVDRAIGDEGALDEGAVEEGAVDERAVGDEGAVGDQGALGGEGVVDDGA